MSFSACCLHPNFKVVRLRLCIPRLILSLLSAMAEALEALGKLHVFSLFLPPTGPLVFPEVGGVTGGTP